MKWTNRGHQLDGLAEKYMRVKNLYIYGAAENGLFAIKLLRWLNIDKDFNILFVDRDVKKQGTFIDEIKVISSEQLYALSSEEKSCTAIVVTPYYDGNKIMDELYAGSFENIFFLQQAEIAAANKHNGFVRNFLCVYLLYKHNKLLSHWTNYLATTKCTLNCKGCLNMTSFIKSFADTTFAEFKHHIDTVFSKYDYLYALHFTGGEPLLCKELSEMIEYVSEKYGERIFDKFFLSNGTVMPSERILYVVKKYNWWISITDYTKAAPQYKETVSKVISTLQENSIKYTIGTPPNWVDLEMGIADYTHLSDDELVAHHDDCNLFWHAFQNGKIYACSYPSYAETAGLYTVTEDDYADIAALSKTELLEFEFGYCNKGYGGLCKRCNGFGRRSKLIPIAEQEGK